ncbi:MAG: hypothetical protein P0S96_04675 [Simkaniaceae bacterium]|nr:hypothetical protein [Candidatus Sacchlamyda saccharinae]
MTQSTSSNFQEQAKELPGLLFERDQEMHHIKNKWNEMFLEYPLKSIIDFWVSQMIEKKQLSKDTISNYRRYLKDLEQREILPEISAHGSPFTLEEFKLNCPFILQTLLKYPELSQQEKRFRLNALVSFTNFLNQITFGEIQKITVPEEFGLKQTIRSPAPKALTLSEWQSFWSALEKISLRDCLIAKTMSFTARPLLKVLELKASNLNFEKNVQVTFTEADGRNCTIQLDSKMKEDLEKYLASIKDIHSKDHHPLFITSRGNPIYRTHLTQVFKRASLEADLGFFVSAKMIQWSHVYDMLRRMNFSKSLITEKLKLTNIPKYLEA